MNAQPHPLPSAPFPENASAPPSRWAGLGFPLLVVGIYWALWGIAGHLEMPMFVAFMSSLAGALIFALCFLGWWFFNRSLHRSEKWLGFCILLAAVLVGGKFSHRTINFLDIVSVGVPLIGTAAVAWLWLVKKSLLPAHRLGFVAAVALPVGALMLVQADGFDAALKTHLSWRWTPNAEERFLAEKAKAAAQQPATNSAPAAPVSAASPDGFRGPDRDGVVHGIKIATDWQSAPPRQLWRQAVGPAWSSLVVAGGRLYTQEQRGVSEAVVCYDSETGRELWAHEESTRFDEAVSGAGPRATPTVAGGRVVSLGATGLLTCLDAASGRRLWSRETTQDSTGKPPMWGMASSPLVAAQNVIVYGGGTAGKSLLAYRLDSGEPVWAANAGQESYSSPQLVTLAGVAQCLMLNDLGLASYALDSGRKLWETGLAMKGAIRCAQPHLFEQSKLAVAILDGPGLSLIEVTKDGDQWHIAPLWASKELKPDFPDFVVHGGFAYGFDSSIFCCLDLRTGKRVWKAGRYGHGQVVLLEDQALLVVVTEAGEAVLLAADGQAQHELGRFQALHGKTWNHPVIAGDRLYLRNAEEMACYALAPVVSK